MFFIVVSSDLFPIPIETLRHAAISVPQPAIVTNCHEKGIWIRDDG